jgi:hypothetical protein
MNLLVSIAQLSLMGTLHPVYKELILQPYAELPLLPCSLR